MAINVTTLFTRIGKMAAAAQTVVTCLGETIEDAVEDAVQQLGGSNTIEYEAVRSGMLTALRSLQTSGSSAISGVLITPASTLVIQTIKDDNPQEADTLLAALEELIVQMQSAGESVNANSIFVTTTYSSSNIGSGKIVYAHKRGDGLVNEHISSEDIVIECTNAPTSGAATFSVYGQPSISVSAYNWPGGSGTSTTITSHTGDSASNLVTNGTFETEDSSASHLPSGWIAPVATLGTTLKMTSVEVQTVAISGGPTGGYYLLHFTDRNGKVQTTAPLAYNASGSDVQTALQGLTGLSGISVSTSGSTPNFTHTITFTGVPAPTELTSTSAFTGGSGPAATHATTTAGSAKVFRGARAVEFDSNGSQLTAIQRKVTVSARTVYAVNLWAIADIVPASGTIIVDLVDGVGGTVIQDDQGAANALSLNCTQLSSSAFKALTDLIGTSLPVFCTPTDLPDSVYLRIRISSAISSGTSVFIDDVCLIAMTQLYTGGLYVAAFTGQTYWELDDLVTLQVLNDRGSSLHEWCNRAFSLRDKDLVLPSVTNGSETQADTLIDTQESSSSSSLSSSSSSSSATSSSSSSSSNSSSSSSSSSNSSSSSVTSSSKSSSSSSSSVTSSSSSSSATSSNSSSSSS